MIEKKYFKSLIYTFFFVFISTLYSNNIQVLNVILTNADDQDHTIDIQFDISWENSWRVSSEPGNYDAAWVFAKYKDESGEWQHVSLAATDVLHTAGAGATIEAVSDGKGIFIYRNSNGTGTFSASGNRIKWNYGDDGLTETDYVGLKLFAIEMVYIPQGNYYAGSDTSDAGDVNALMVVGSGYAQPFLISTSLVNDIKSEGTGISDSQDDEVVKAINGYSGIGIDGDDGLDTDNDGTVDNLNFPTGYSAFYLMKYELSQIQYVEFLNSLTRAQQNNRTYSQIENLYAMTSTSSPVYRNGIRVPSSVGAGVIMFGCDINANGIFNEPDDGTAIAANFLKWGDIVAYLDWAGLRLFTELEFVKAARGTLTPNSGEYVWGNLIYQTAGSFGLNNQNQEGETTVSINANVHVAPSSIGGPLRVGNFADISTNRGQAGSGYYGNMDLAGNLWELVIPLGSSVGRAFTGLNGDGQLTISGEANVPGWPLSFPIRIGKRGGPFLGSINEAKIANRNYAAKPYYSGDRKEYDGCRGARSAK